MLRFHMLICAKAARVQGGTRQVKINGEKPAAANWDESYDNDSYIRWDVPMNGNGQDRDAADQGQRGRVPRQ